MSICHTYPCCWFLVWLGLKRSLKGGRNCREWHAIEVYNEKEDVLKYKLGLHELHPSIDWRTKHFIMNILELKGENTWPVDIYPLLMVFFRFCRNILKRRKIQETLSIHSISILKYICQTWSTSLTTAVPDCQVWQRMGTGDDVCKGDEPMSRCSCRLCVQLERYIMISACETDSSGHPTVHCIYGL